MVWCQFITHTYHGLHIIVPNANGRREIHFEHGVRMGVIEAMCVCTTPESCATQAARVRCSRLFALESQNIT